MVLLLSLACRPADTDLPPATALRVLEANLGNPDEALGGPCPAAPYHGATCSIAQEQATAANIAAFDPDVVFMMEILDADYCTAEFQAGDPDLACTGAPDRDVYQQAARYVGPDYTVVCDSNEHYDCVAVRSSRVLLAECPSGVCEGAALTAPRPENCGSAGIDGVSAAHATVDDRPLTLVFAHPIATGTDDPCRIDQYRQAFEELPVGDTLIAGDFNADPYRVPSWDASAYFFTQVGDGKPFTAISVDADPPTPTFVGVITLDYVLSNAMTGACDVLGVDAGTVRLDDPVGTNDHQAVACSVDWPSLPI